MVLLFYGAVLLLSIFFLDSVFLNSKLVVNVLGRFLVYLDVIKGRHIKSRRPKRIILIRHGQSEGNADPSIYERVPDNKLNLTSKGIGQAHECGKKLGEMIGKESALFILSPFNRTKQTYENIRAGLAEVAGADDEGRYYTREDPRVRELEWGNFQETEQMENVLQTRNWCGRFYYRFHDGESGADVYDRASSFMESMFRGMDSVTRERRENVIIISHGLFMRLFLMRFLYWTVKEFESVWNPQNCDIWVLSRQEDGEFKLETELGRSGAATDDGTVPKEVVQGDLRRKASFRPSYKGSPHLAPRFPDPDVLDNGGEMKDLTAAPHSSYSCEPLM
eukprot:CAMPEP_0194687256 /NCGR_PEP_ID=MMETSP0295-20121207/16097_1 /TAXON_ID=39354 /ORGANISM="Heterosigma akashiwo, Strain CCMP2393" /LENGTH=334 /DNA_ID=CAMNT_0039575451 /DNA_START=195 /DNA_END=1199 /DNA_ORIENTATION=-